MQKRGRRLKFTAVLAMVVLALTGFSSGRGHGSRHSSGGGGGCSSSSQNHDSSSSSTSSGGSYSSGSTTSGSTDDYDDPYDDSTSSSSTGSTGSTGSSGSSYNRRPTHRSTSSSGTSTLEDGTAKLISCATKKKPYATVEVTNPNSRKATFATSVTFKDEADIWITDEYAEVTVPAKGKATVRVEVGGSGLIDSVDHCEVDRLATTGS
ncbi:hypothetical protein ACFVYF_10345 [Streptomyces sp. NPDC058274]|uniref:hypothetical protein n=1 Tax=Streptomyces sp. NPDC058274 TaxID=3346416 RepID=UPI0036EEF60A